MSTETKSAGLTVRECIAQIVAGTLTSVQLVSDCLAVIDASEESLRAWKYLDREHALEQARILDDMRRRGKPLGVLHGIPVGVKDIFDTSDMPTEHGSEIYAGRTTEHDAAVIEKLREQGAVILGKTVTTELAYMNQAETRNPHNTAYSPGGSSCGSAAAVGAGQVPLALGTQTNGSVIRPASFCGTYGFKPSRGVVSRRGVLETSPTLDQIGVLARDPGDMALLVDVIKGYDATDFQSYLAPRPRMLEGYRSHVPIEPTFAWIKMPYADQCSADTRGGMAEIVSELGAQVDELEAPQSFEALIKCHKIIHEVEINRAFETIQKSHREEISAVTLDAMDRAKAISDAEYTEALEILEAANQWFAEFYNDYDAIVAPSALDIAPLYGDGTGDPICCTIWTLCGLPCVTMPLLSGAKDLPIGVQLVGALNEDDRLLRTTRWFLNHLQGQA